MLRCSSIGGMLGASNDTSTDSSPDAMPTLAVGMPGGAGPIEDMPTASVGMAPGYAHRGLLSGSLAILLALSGLARAADSDASPLGFSPSSRAAQRKAEAHALAVPTPDNARAWLRALTEEPHVAGTRADYRTAHFVRDKLRDWGWQAELVEYEVLLNYPRRSPTLKLVRPDAKEISLVEAPNPADKDSASPAAFPAFHGYGVSGEVTGQVVYANYGRPEDFTALDRMGIEVRDKIVLVRYGDVFRGLKVRNAQKRGAKGILIYSDPGDDGYARGDVYPNGPYRPASSVQRGSVQFLSLGPGDPSTPNGPSVKGAKRLPWDRANGFTLRETTVEEQLRKEAQLSVEDWEKATGLKREDYFATIPSLPISYEAAKPIFEALGGASVPAGWQGGLPLAYHVGPGPAEVHFTIEMEYDVRSIWNVIAKIEGAVEPDRWVLVSNHRDAWVYGAVDPSSGTSATMEACRAIGSAVKNGWKPRRTLVYASWDAEEYGLVGSTEWADEHAKELDQKAVMLLNVDSAVGGHELDLDGIPSLRDMLLDAAGDVRDVRSGRTLRESWVERKRAQWAANSPIEFNDDLWGAPAVAELPRGPVSSASAALSRPPAAFSPMLNALGSGSDYTAFVDHLAIPSMDVGFGGRYGVYHSIFDNFYWMEKFCDPEFLTHATAARLYTLIAMRAAGADVLPLTFTPYGEALRDHVDDLRRMLERRARALPPGASAPMEFAGLRPLVMSIREFQFQATALDRATSAVLAADVDSKKLALLNDAIQKVERAFLLSDGLPGRPWFKHAIYAPGLTTGYTSWPLPGPRQAILDNDGAMLAAAVPLLEARISAAAAALRLATKEAVAALPAPVDAKEPAKPATEKTASPAAPSERTTPAPVERPTTKNATVPSR